MTKHVVYLHGFASGPGSTKARYFANKLASIGITADIPDLNAGDFENLTIGGQLDVIRRTAGNDAPALIGSSLGGYLAALYAVRYPETPRVVLLAPGFGFPRRYPAMLGADKAEAWRTAGFITVPHYGENRERRLSYRLIEEGQAYEDYPDVKQPCLIFHGRHDPVVPVGSSIEFARDRPNVELHVEDSGHELTDVMERMWERMRTFLDE